ncbi:MAG: type II toxin-antitoxin system RelE/ParE family toxin [Acidobacteria bacterium]|nr:type II toxin-antitoxin system RelE/ParE family toxin [Acidobacteriota bacterium]
MKTAFHSSFAKDLRAIKDQTFRDRVAKLIQSVEAAADLAAIPNLKRLHGPGSYYRIRLGEFRVGITLRAEVVSFVRCLHRKESYRYFP